MTDAMFAGRYHGKKAHEDDLIDVLDRAAHNGVNNIFVTAGCHQDIEDVSALIDRVRKRSTADPSTVPMPKLQMTIGCHPTRTSEMSKIAGSVDEYIDQLRAYHQKHEVDIVAYGEFGLDYDRLHFSDRDTQLRGFRAQLGLAADLGLPLFLHDRNTGGDFGRELRNSPDGALKAGGVVHSFTGPLAEAQEYLDLGLHIGINGCSLKTEENIAVIRELPLDRIMLETDAPWCEIKRTHASHAHLQTKGQYRMAGFAHSIPAKGTMSTDNGKGQQQVTTKKTQTNTDPWAPVDKKKWQRGRRVKGRCEPCQIVEVCEVVAAVHGMTREEVAEVAFQNTRSVFTRMAL
eukprot:Clim_evm4s165 gene=Clim_evmTU4s165